MKTDYARSLEAIIVWYCRLFKKKYFYFVLTSHELETNTKKLDHFVFEILRDDQVTFICQNEFQKNQVKRVIGSEKCHVIHNLFRVNPSNVPFETQNTEKFVLWIGRNEDSKNFQAWFRICSNLPPEIKKTMICTFNAGNFVTYENMKEQVKNISNFILIKKDKYEDTQPYFKKALVLVNTSFYEGLPNTFIQASFEGIPIGTLFYDTDGMVSLSGCGFCSQGVEKKLAEFISRLACDEKFLIERKENSRRLYLTKFDYTANVNRLIHIMNH
ncbi:MAG: glycosyltransferase [Oligoflexia bacterium]|nr:glycosyltransferase [Oligoflexia bacterium]